MVICKDLEHIQYFDKSALTIGALDGMHLGHSEIIAALKAMSKANNIPSVVITFDPHPRTVLQPSGQFIESLLSFDKKMEFLEKFAVDYVWVIPFDIEFSKLSAREFLKKYISAYFNPMDIVIGYDHHFGFNREGNGEFLDNNKDEYGYNLHIINPILYHGKPISSSQIRSYLKNSKIDKANECLGWKYQLTGVVVKGQGKGTKLDFPTANIQPHFSHQLIPAQGVYCINAIIENSSYKGMCNIGHRPTFYENGEKIIEVHIFSKDALNLYDKDILVTFNKYLRGEKKYNSSSDLTKQLQLDRQACLP